MPTIVSSLKAWKNEKHRSQQPVSNRNNSWVTTKMTGRQSFLWMILSDRYRCLSTVVVVSMIFVIVTNLRGNHDDIYARTSFCDRDGTCHEKPDQPSPRTIYSAKSQDQYEQWWKAHAILNQTALDYAAQLPTSRRVRGKRPLILYGDSITEAWRGLALQQPNNPRTLGIPDVLEETLGQSQYGLDILVAAISGDQTQHLLYRMQNGQLLPAFAQEESAVFVVLIGTNNLGSGELPGPTAQGIIAVIEYLLQHSKGYVLLLKLLPRGDDFRMRQLCPPRCFKSFLPAIKAVNEALDEYMSNEEQQQQQRLRIVDCGQPFFTKDGTSVKKELMPDLLHPNADGHRMMANCIISALHDGFGLFA